MTGLEPTPPSSLEAWQAQRDDARAKLWTALGDLPPLFTPTYAVTETKRTKSYILERFSFDNGAGATVPGYLAKPLQARERAPAVLYLHAHGGRYERGKDEIFDTRGGMIPVEALTRAGYAVMCVDAYGFGEREAHGPGGAVEHGRDVEMALYKQFIWRGQTLWGMMVRDDILSLNLLASLPEIDSERIAAVGMSLGASRTTWLSALDERIRVAVPIAQMTRYADYAAAGEYNHHGIYYYVPNMLNIGFDMEVIAAMTAPRTQSILIGDSDRLSPLSGIRTVARYARAVYLLYGAEQRLESVVYQGIGHEFTAAMFADLMAALRRGL
jgi:dienelactone hydrolase